MELSMLRRERIHLSSSCSEMLPSGPICWSRWPESDMGWWPERVMGWAGSKRCWRWGGGWGRDEVVVDCCGLDCAFCCCDWRCMRCC